MIQKNNNISVLPFYTDEAEQNHRRSYAYGEIYPLYTPMGSMPPFQIVHPFVNSLGVVNAYLYKADGTLVGDKYSEMTTAGLRIRTFQDYGYSVILFPSIAPMNLTTEEGRYYLVLYLTDNTYYYSDIFTVVGDMSGYLNIVWHDVDDLVMDGGRIVYLDAGGRLIYRNSLWLATQLGKPEYTFEEEGEQRDGLFFAEKRISYKKYKCTILATEPLCDVMRFIALSDFIYCIDQYGNKYPCDTFLITPKWQEQGDLASVDIEFTCDTVAKKIGRARSLLDSFNDDYNNDFDITD